MDEKTNEHQALSAREQQLQERELDLRLRELELDIYRQDAPDRPTAPNRGGSNKPVRSLKQNLILAAKLSGLFATGVVVIYIIHWLVWISLFASIGAAGWFWYKYRVKNRVKNSLDANGKRHSRK
jgi:Flp pilus assembly protein TadB